VSPPRLFNVVRGEQDGGAFITGDAREILPDLAAEGGIDTNSGLYRIEERCIRE
jgi:hypothetical protein